MENMCNGCIADYHFIVYGLIEIWFLEKIKSFGFLEAIFA